MENKRIDTLVLPIEPKAARPPRLDRNGSVWAAAAKLGRYLMSGMTQEEREGLALPLLRAISRTAGEECEPPAASVASAFALYFVKLRWTCSALNLDTVGVQLEHRRRLVPCFVVCLVYFMRECLFR